MTQATFPAPDGATILLTLAANGEVSSATATGKDGVARSYGAAGATQTYRKHGAPDVTVTMTSPTKNSFSFTFACGTTRLVYAVDCTKAGAATQASDLVYDVSRLGGPPGSSSTETVPAANLYSDVCAAAASALGANFEVISYFGQALAAAEKTGFYATPAPAKPVALPAKAPPTKSAPTKPRGPVRAEVDDDDDDNDGAPNDSLDFLALGLLGGLSVLVGGMLTVSAAAWGWPVGISLFVFGASFTDIGLEWQNVRARLKKGYSAFWKTSVLGPVVAPPPDPNPTIIVTPLDPNDPNPGMKVTQLPDDPPSNPNPGSTTPPGDSTDDPSTSNQNQGTPPPIGTVDPPQNPAPPSQPPGAIGGGGGGGDIVDHGEDEYE